MIDGFILSGARRLSTTEIQDRARQASNAFLQDGVREGDAIAILLRNDTAFLEAMLAANNIGAYSVPINSHFTPEEVGYILRDCAARHLVVHADLLRGVRSILPEGIRVLCVTTPPEVMTSYRLAAELCTPSDPCDEWDSWLRPFGTTVQKPALPRGSMTYTSGTTGLPKGVRREPVRDQDQSAYQQLRQQWFGFRPGMRTAVIGPMYHSVQATYAIAALHANGGAVLLPKFDARTVLELIHTYRLTHLHLVPTMMNRLVQLSAAERRRYDLSSLEFVVHGAAPCSPDVKRALIDWWGPIIHEYYGTTEAGMVSRADSNEWLSRVGTVGRAWPGRTIRVYDEAGNVVPPGTKGEIYVSLGVLPDFTYHNADAKRAAIGRDGLVTNGDIGYLDEEGYLFLCDRKHDLAISAGVNIYPAEIEAVLITHPAVYDCAVFGIPDDDLGESLAAAVQLQPDSAVTEGDLSAFLRTRLAKIKVPRRFEFRSALPRDASGKIFKRELRAPYWQHTTRRI